MKRRTLVIILVLVVLVGAGGYVFARSRASQNTTALSKYATASVQRGDVTVTISDNGTILGQKEQSVKPAASGTVASVNVQVGSKVTEGQVLAALSNDSLGDQIATARSNLAIEQLRYADMKAPPSKASQNSIDLATQKVDQAKRTLALRQQDLANLTVAAPISGLATAVSVSTGDSVSAGSAAFTIIDLNNMTMTLSVSQLALNRVYVGQTGTAVFGNGPTRTGTVTYINPQGVPRGLYDATYSVTFTLDNPGTDDGLRPGMSGGVTLPHPKGQIAMYTSAVAKTANVTAKTSGTAAAVNIQAGDTVTAGQILLTMTNDSLVASEKQAEIDLASAENSLDTMKNPESTVTTTDLQAEEAKLSQMQASLDSLLKQQADLVVTAPLGGVVTASNLKVGDSAGAGGATPAFTIVDLSKMVVTINVDELDINQVKLGQTGTVAVQAIGGKSFPAKVTNVSLTGTVAQGVTTYPVELTLGKNDGILAGMTGDVTIMIAQRQNVLTVPVEAVTTSRGHSFVRVVEGTELKSVEVQIGLADDQNIEITGGLQEGQTVVTGTSSSGSGGLFGGMGGFGGTRSEPARQQGTQSTTGGR
ncbi:MAG TPA: efflux RND transporter periplasmic adaptor subunit [Bacillota bacterium]